MEAIATADVDKLTIHAHLTLVFKITFVGNNNNGEGVLVFDTQNLLMESADFLKRVS